ncbi:MAG TPA: hypothetical protein VEU08_03820 [Vicinamibacterales bacterium]|nr:hypothetical protein [Vicinamibacterales bacterium]
MLSNKLAFAALAVACIAAAAGGGYLASRQNAVPAPAAAQSQAPAYGVPATAPAPAAATDRPVQETEAVVGDRTTTSSRRAEKPRETTRTARVTMPPPASQATPAAVAAPQPPVALPPPPAPLPEAAAPRPDDRVVQPPPPPEPPKPQFEELVVSRDSVIGLQTEGRVSSETAKVEDRIEARVTRDVRVADRIAIPAGTRAIGAVTLVERGGKFKERGRLGIRFHTLVFADGTRLPVNTETIYREGEAPGQDSAKKIGGGAVVGTILGGILGGAKGAAIGATAGAGAGTAAVAAGDRSEAVLMPGTPLTVRLNQPVTVMQER